MSQSEELIRTILSEFPGFRIVPKEGNALSRTIDLGLKIVTFGRQRNYLTEYHTVIGNTLYVPPRWSATSDIERTILLRHERIHLRQRRKYGALGMAVLYLFVFLPCGLAWGRARLEWEAYSETLRATAELLGKDAARDLHLRQTIVRRFIGPDYAWMWPFRSQVESWYDRALAEIDCDQTPNGSLALRMNNGTHHEGASNKG